MDEFTNSKKNTQELKDFILGKLFVPLVGVALTSGLPFHEEIVSLKEKFPFAVVIGYKVSYAVTATLIDGPNKLYFAHYRQLNYQLDRAATIIAQWIELKGYEALPIPASQTVDWERQLGHFSHRHAAVAAGLAFWGRNNLAITPEFGAHQRWASILTDMPLIAGKPLNMDCGECRACIASCPVGAIGESRHDWDYEKCFAKLKEFTKRGIGHYICGLCVKPCRGKLGR